MHKSFFIGWLGLCLLLLTQCTMQKRVYRKGWYISFKKEWRNPENDQSQKFVSENQRKDAADLAVVTNFQQVESTLTETAFDDSSPKSNSVTEELEIQDRNALPASDYEDTIVRIAADSEQLSTEPSKASVRPAWVKKLAIFLFCAAVILTIALLIATSPLDLATSVTFSGIALAVIFFAFLIGFSVYNNKKKPTKNKHSPEKKIRLLTPEEQAEKKRSRKRGAIVVTVFSAIVFFLILLLAFSLSSFVFLLPFGAVFVFFILVGWVEFLRPRPMEMTEDAAKQYRQKTENEKQAELKKHKRNVLVSIIFWTVIFILSVLIAVSLESLLFLLVGGAVCLLLIMIACLEYFRWKPNDTVEIEPVPEKETIMDTPKPDNDETVNQKPRKTPEEQRKSNRKGNIAVGLILAIVAAFFIIHYTK